MSSQIKDEYSECEPLIRNNPPFGQCDRRSEVCRERCWQSVHNARGKGGAAPGLLHHLSIHSRRNDGKPGTVFTPRILPIRFKLFYSPSRSVGGMAYVQVAWATDSGRDSE